ncbi:unnamed protein product [Scytosiphon promiscuus]
MAFAVVFFTPTWIIESPPALTYWFPKGLLVCCVTKAKLNRPARLPSPNQRTNFIQLKRCAVARKQRHHSTPPKNQEACLSPSQNTPVRVVPN